MFDGDVSDADVEAAVNERMMFLEMGQALGAQWRS